MKIKTAVKKSFEKVEKIAERQSGFLGRADGVVRVTGKRHWVYVRLWDGSVIEAYNQNAPANFGLAVNVLYQGGRYLAQARQVYNEMVNTSIPDGIEEELQWPNQRALYVRPEQFLAGLVYPKSGMVVYLFGGTVRLPGSGFALIPPQEIDLEAYRPASGATWAVIALESSGAASVTTGGDAASWQALALADIPTTTGFPVAGVRLFAGQTSIQHGKFGSMIQDLRWFQQGSGGSISLPTNRLVATDDDGLPADNAPIWSADGLATWSEEEYTWPGLNLMGIALAGESLTPGAVFIRANSTATSASLINFTKFGGSLASPSAILSGWRLGSFQFGGHYGDGIDFTKARISAEATEDWSDPNRGTKIKLEATPSETNAIETVAEFGGDEITLHKLGYGVTPASDADGAEIPTTEWVRDNAPGGVSDHNELNDIQGGTDDEYYHLTSAQQGVVEDIAALTPTENHSLVWSLSGWTTAKRVEEAPDDGNVYGRKNTVWTNLRTIFDALYVALTGNQTVAGIKTFSSFPVTPSAAPTANYEVANKKYVDDATSGVGIPEAPEDGYIYGRKDADWEAVDGIGFDSFQTEEGLTYTRTSGGSYAYVQQRLVLYRPIKLSAIKWDIRGTGTYTLSLRKADATTEIESIAVSCPGTSRVTFSLAADRIMAPGSYVVRMTAPSSVQWYDADTTNLDMYYDGWGIIQPAIYGGSTFNYRAPVILVFYNSSQGNVTNTVLDNVRYLLPFSSYNTLGSPMSSSPLYPYAATLPGFAIYPKRWSQGVFIGATNNASNYWTIELIASVSGSDTTIATLNTSALGASAAAVLTTTTFSPTSLTQGSNIRLAIKVTKVGSPSNLSAHGPALEYTLA